MIGKSKGHRYWNKFSAWAGHEGLVHSERPEALQEFLVDPARVPEDARTQVQTLFEGWFLLERRLTRARATPLELFIRTQERRLKAAELAVYQRFAAEHRFGFFKAESVVRGKGLELRQLPDGGLFPVADIAASESIEPGAVLITRLVPFEDRWLLEGAVGRFPEEASYDLDRLFGTGGGALKAGELRPRNVLPLFMPKLDWEKEGLPRVKARAAMLLQRWGVADLSVSGLEGEIAAAQERRDLPGVVLKTLAGRAPSKAAADEALELLQAWWNLTLPKSGAEPPRGPKETSLLRDLHRFVAARLGPAGTEAAAERLVAEWRDAPQAELGGRTPMEIIALERKLLGNPRTELGITVIPEELDLGPEEEEAVELANQATARLVKGDAAGALELLEKAYPLMKGRDDAFRVLGKLATASMMLGRREDALRWLRAALRANPDYDSARNNLALLESLSPEEFAAKHRSGFFRRTQVVKG
ncbi:MAG: hypothetical protein HY928_06865 [Elusimicrobia bacterium]|nr:hypothetical protein [Elusimicrobiota bacterium]